MALRDNFPKARISDSHYFFTLSRGEAMRCFALRPWAVYSLGCLIPLCGLLYFSASMVFLMRDPVVSTVFKRQQAMQQAYEDRIAAMRAQLDRVSSRQLLDQNSLEGKMHNLLSRQAKLETRSAIVAAIAGRLEKPGSAIHSNRTVKRASAHPPMPPARPKSLSRSFARHVLSTDHGRKIPKTASAPNDVTGSLPGPVSAYAANSPLRASAIGALNNALANKPRPGSVTFAPENGSKTDKRKNSNDRAQVSSKSLMSALAGTASLPVDLRLGAVSQSLDKIATSQLRRLSQLGNLALERTKKLRKVIASTGLPPGIFSRKNAGRKAGTGGPFVPYKLDPKGPLFERAVLRIQKAVVEADHLRRAVNRLPVRKPVTRGASVSSRYGRRVDPINGRLASHTGIDFKQRYGAPVLATAAGKVIKAGYNGGYGRVVEIYHGSGITTRYAHLSRIHVKKDQQIIAGTRIGRIGSTGRSTGPHLHYEVRLNGRPTNPGRFLRAGRKLSLR